MKKNIGAVLVLVAVFVILASPCPAANQAANPREVLKQYIADLQKTPSDNSLREKIIKLVRTMQPPPTLPEEARRHYVIAITLIKDAKDMKEYLAATDELSAALQVAPWWGQAYRDLGVAYKSAERYEEAMWALRFYLLTVPKDSDARNAQDEIYIIEAKQKKLIQDRAAVLEKEAEAKRQAEAAQLAEEQKRKAAEEQARADERIAAQLVGVWHPAPTTVNLNGKLQTWVSGYRFSIAVDGRKVSITCIGTPWVEGYRSANLPLFEGSIQNGALIGKANVIRYGSGITDTIDQTIEYSSQIVMNSDGRSFQALDFYALKKTEIFYKE